MKKGNGVTAPTEAEFRASLRAILHSPNVQAAIAAAASDPMQKAEVLRILGGSKMDPFRETDHG